MPLLDEMKQVAADVFGAETRRRLAEVSGEGSDALDVGLDRSWAKLRRVMSSIMRRRKAVMSGSLYHEMRNEAKRPLS